MVLELACLRLKGALDSSLLTILQQAKTDMEHSSNLPPFYYLQQVEDPQIIYIVGAWPSVAYHYETFIPSAENQRTLGLLKDKVDVEWLFHVNLDKAAIPFDEKAKVLAIGRHFLKPGERASFQTTFEARKALLAAATDDKLAGGWREDKDGDKEEWVLFTGWEDVQSHTAFGDSAAFQEYAEIKKHLEGFEVKHACSQSSRHST